MCDYCRHIFYDIKEKHTPLTCEYRLSMYCEMCCVKGHTSIDCPNKKGWALRMGYDPEQVENFEVVLPASHAAIENALKYFGYPLAPDDKKSLEEKKKFLQKVCFASSPPRLVLFKE